MLHEVVELDRLGALVDGVKVVAELVMAEVHRPHALSRPLIAAHSGPTTGVLMVGGGPGEGRGESRTALGGGAGVAAGGDGGRGCSGRERRTRGEAHPGLVREGGVGGGPQHRR